MNKTDIITQVCEKLGFSQRASSHVVEHFFTSSLVSGANVKISRLGNFMVRKKRARRGRNPRTGVAIEIGPRTALIFKHSKVLKEEMRSTAEQSPPALL